MQIVLLAKTGLWLAVCGVLAAVSAQGQSVLYVNQAASGAGDGTTWVDAFPSLQDALTAAQSGDEIWVAAGTYRPDQGRDVTQGEREASFHLENGVAFYGGFIGTETCRDERDWETNETVLSGDLLGNDSNNVDIDEPTRSENSYHVVIAGEGTDTTAVFDGFTITGGHANTSSLRFGGGMLIERRARVRLAHLVFQANVADNCGGAIVNYGDELTIMHARFSENHAASDDFCGGGALYHNPYSAVGEDNVGPVRLHDVRFERNSTHWVGGAISVHDAAIIMTNGVFIANEARILGGAVFHNHIHRGGARAVYANVAFFGNITTEEGGGAMFNEQSIVSVFNAVFSGNEFRSTGQFTAGGAIVNIEASEVVLINTTLVGNSAPRAGAIYNSNSNLVVWNSIVWGNQSEEPGKEAFDLFGPFLHRIGHSIVEGGVPEEAIDEGNNLELDPRFVDADGPDDVPGTEDDDLRLQRGSPAIDAGVNSALPSDSLDFDGDGDLAELLPIDLAGNLRIYDGGSGMAVVDMGAYEFDAPPVRVTVERVPPERAEQPVRWMVYPNPFRDQTTLEFSLHRSGPVQVMLYDALGRPVGRLYEGVPSGGQRHTLRIEGKGLAAGVYFVRLLGAGIDTTQTILLLR